MSGRLNFEDDGHDWPNRQFSRFVEAGGIRWHVQVAGEHPCTVVLIHGTGASSHSWRALVEPLMQQCTVIVPDLPGHGFSGPPSERDAMSLPAMAAGLNALCRALPVAHGAPTVWVGHSAGAAIAMRASLDHRLSPLAPDAIISLNGALLPFPGLAGHLLSPMARGMARMPLVAQSFAWHVRSDRQVIRELLRQTGSQLDAQGVAYYRRLASNPCHVQAALDMMAAWDLHALAQDLPRLSTPCMLVGADRDGTVPARQADDSAQRISGARVVRLQGLGHLAHEEAPQRVARLIGEVVGGLAGQDPP